MKKLLLPLLFLLVSVNILAQSGPPAPSSGIWAIIDTNYTVGPTSSGHTAAKLTLKNTTLTKYTGVQFRVFYDKVAFTNATVSLIGSTTNLDLQYVTNTTDGYITITLVYTGASSTFTLADDERFLIDFTHAAPAIFNNITTISNLTWTGVQTFSQVAAEQNGTDITLGLHSYGGIFEFQTLKFHGTFLNVTGTPAKNLPLALEKRPSSGGSWTQVNTYFTDINGKFDFTENIDTSYWDVRLAIQGDTMGVGNIISTTDAQQINQWLLGVGTMSGFDYYHADVNGTNSLSISDVWGVFGRII